MRPDFKSMKVEELKHLAKQAGIVGSDGMKKAELIAALEKPIESAKASQEEAQKMIDSGEAEIPADAIIDPIESSSMNSDLAKHPKFAKFKSQGEKQP